jgi:hypothetical protein
MKRFDKTTPWEKRDKPEVIASTPSRPADLWADLLVPLGQSVASGILGASLIVLLVPVVRPDWRGDLFRVWAVAALLVTTGVWLWLLRENRRAIWATETRPGQATKTKDQVVLVNVPQAREEAAKRARAERVNQFARFVGALEVRGTDSRTWEPELGRPTYNEFRDVLLRMGWARWNSTKWNGKPNERQGWSLVLPPGEILDRIN